MGWFSFDEGELRSAWEVAAAAGERYVFLEDTHPSDEKRTKLLRDPAVWAVVTNPTPYRYSAEKNAARPNAVLRCETAKLVAWLTARDAEREYAGRSRRYVTEEEAAALLEGSGAVRVVSPDDMGLRGWLRVVGRSSTVAVHVWWVGGEGSEEGAPNRAALVSLTEYNGAMMRLEDGRWEAEFGKWGWRGPTVSE